MGVGHYRPDALAAPGARRDEDTRDTRDLDDAEPDTKDVEEVEVEHDTRPYMANLEPDTMAHDEDTGGRGLVAFGPGRPSAAPLDHLSNPPPTMLVDRNKPTTACDVLSTQAMGELPVEREAGGASAGAEEESLLSDLPTETYEPSVMEADAKRAAREAGRLRSEQETQPFSRSEVAAAAGRARRRRWQLPALAGLVLAALAVGLLTAQRVSDRNELELEAQRLCDAVAQVLTTSETPLASEERLIDRLAEDWELLREALGGESPAVARAGRGIRSLKALLAVQRGELKVARAVVTDPTLAELPRLALAGGIAAHSSGDALTPLDAVLARGFVRPEFRAWRALARLRGLDASDSVDAEVLLPRLDELEALEPLSDELHLRRVRALITLQRWERARAELERVEDPDPELRGRIERGQLEQIVRESPPERALAWVAAHQVGVDEDSRAAGRHALTRAHGRLLALREGRELGEPDQRTLLSELRLAHRLGWRPLPDSALETLGLALRREELSGPCLLALATLGTKDSRRQVLVTLAQRLEAAKQPAERLRLRLLQGTIVASRQGQELDAEALVSLNDPRALRELAAARVAALLADGRPRKALLEAQRALSEHADDPELLELKQQAVAALAPAEQPQRKP